MYDYAPRTRSEPEVEPTVDEPVVANETPSSNAGAAAALPPAAPPSDTPVLDQAGGGGTKVEADVKLNDGVTGTLEAERSQGGTTTSGSVTGGVGTTADGDLRLTGGATYGQDGRSGGVTGVVEVDEDGDIVGYGAGLTGEWKFDKLKVGGGVAIEDTRQERVLDAATAEGADAAVVENLGGGPVLSVGVEHRLKLDLGVGGRAGAYGAQVGVGHESGTAVTFYRAIDPAQLPTDPAAVEALADQVGWPNLAEVYSVRDVDLLAMQPGTAYRFDDFSASSGRIGASAYGVGVSLGVSGQDYESVMISRTDDETVRISVMATDEAGWNAGLDFKGLSLASTEHAAGDSTLVELDVDVTTPEGQQALEIFRTTGALPGSYGGDFAAQALALSSLEQRILAMQAASATATDPSQLPDPAELELLRAEYAELSAELQAQATGGNAAFVQDPANMERDLGPGVTYGHRRDEQLQRDRQALLGMLQWGSSETLAQDRLFVNDALNVTYTMDREEQSFVAALLSGVHGREQAGSVVNPHDGTFDVGVFATRTMTEEDRALLATLPANEDLMTRLWVEGQLEMDAVGTVGVFLNETHVTRLGDAFDEMRAQGVDPLAAATELMDQGYQVPLTTLLVLEQEGLVSPETLARFSESQADVNALAATDPARFAALPPEQREIYLGLYLQAAETVGANPWTSLDLVRQLPPGDERDQLMNTVAIQIERLDEDHATGAFQMIELIDDLGAFDPEAREDLQTAVVVNVTDRGVKDDLAMSAEDRRQLYVEGFWGDGGAWQFATGSLLENVTWAAQQGIPIEDVIIDSDVREITTMVVAADRAGELDPLLQQVSGGDPIALLDATASMPGNQQLLLDAMLRSPTWGPQARAWAEANGLLPPP